MIAVGVRLTREGDHVKNANVAHWIVSISALGIAASSLALWIRTPRAARNELVLSDELGNPRIHLVATKTGGSIQLLGVNARVLASLAHDGASTSLMLNRTGEKGRGIELVVPDSADGPATQASASIFSFDAEEVAVLAAGPAASLHLTSIGGGHLHLAQGKQTEISATYAENWATMTLTPIEGTFSTQNPFTMHLWKGYRLNDGSTRQEQEPQRLP